MKSVTKLLWIWAGINFLAALSYNNDSLYIERNNAIIGSILTIIGINLYNLRKNNIKTSISFITEALLVFAVILFLLFSFISTDRNWELYPLSWLVMPVVILSFYFYSVYKDKKTLKQIDGQQNKI